MRKIILLCNMGMSTSMMVTKMRTAAEAEGYECVIAAHSISRAKEVGVDADCILVGPQSRMRLSYIREECPGVPVKDIEMRDYGMMNGAAVLKMAQTLIGE